MTGASIERARAAKAAIAELLDEEADVCGIGIAAVDGGYCVKVNVAGAAAAAALRVPDEVDGVPVVVVVISEILPL